MSNIYTNVPMFNAQYYLDNNPDLVAAGYTVETVGEHYFEFGAAETLEGGGRVGPNAWFDIQFYREMNPDLEGLAAGDLLLHFATYGAREGRNPNPEFGDGQSINANLFLDYALANPDVAEAYGIPADATRLTDEQQANVAYQFFAWGVNEEREGGIASVIEVPVALEEAIAAYNDAVTAADTADAAADAAATKETEAKAALNTAKGETADALAKLFAAATPGLLPSEGADGDFAALTPAEQDLAVQSAQNVLNAQLNAAKTEVNKLEGDAPVVAEALIAAQEALAAAQKDTIKEGVLFGALGATGAAANGSNALDGSALKAFLAANPGDGVGTEITPAELTVDTTTSFSVSIDDAVIIQTSLTGELFLTEAAADYEGTAALLTAANAYQAALNAENVAVQGLGAAVVAAADAGLLAAAADGFKELPAGTKFDFDPAGTLKVVGGTATLAAVWSDVTVAGASIVNGEFTITDGAAGFGAGVLDSGAKGEADLQAAIGLYGTLATAQAAADNFAQAAQDWKAAKEAEATAGTKLEDAETAAADAVTAADAAHTELDAAQAAVEKAAGDDVNVVFEADDNGVYQGQTGVDLFILGEEDITIESFGKGEDKIFIPNISDYTVVTVEAGKSIQDIAKADVLEIFVQEIGGNTVISVEDEVFSGSVNGTLDLSTITLTGVTGEVSISDDGFLVIG